MALVPKKVFFVKGKGYHKYKSNSFKEALKDAEIEKFNLLEVSSILPPNCIEIDKKSGLQKLKTGKLVYSVISKISSNKSNLPVSSSIGVAKPTNKERHGYLSEHHSVGMNPQKVGKFAENLAIEMLVTSSRPSNDLEGNYNFNKGDYRWNEEIRESKNITESAFVRKEGEWLTTIAAAIFIL